MALPPGIRSRSAPNARDAPLPIECTPATSRAAMPAIFCTTDAAIEVFPWVVASPIAAGLAPEVVAGLLEVIVLLLSRRPGAIPCRRLVLRSLV
ncbi:hypothetical protein Pdca_41530 [Pseudonocardia autotrophica]|nr:hypothetical protein Pdca_41530 [Pseudonocardia autotrophica]